MSKEILENHFLDNSPAQMIKKGVKNLEDGEFCEQAHFGESGTGSPISSPAW